MLEKTVKQNYIFTALLLLGIAGGCAVGAVWPGATCLEPLGTVFINMMFCIVVPLVFASIAGAISNMRNRKRGGRIIGVSVALFMLTCAVAAVIMVVLVKLYPPVTVAWQGLEAGEVGEQASVTTLIVNFFTVSDFSGLLSRRAMLPLIVFSILFGFCTNACGGPDCAVGKFLNNLTDVMLRFVKLVSYYAPIGFFGFFAYLVAYYGPQLIGDYGRGMLLYYPLCFVYLFTMYPLYAYIGGGKDAPKAMSAYLLRPAMTAFGTCSSVATIPTNMDVAKQTGISKDVSDIVLPLGASMHMEGSCFSCVLKVAFLCGVFGMPFEGIGTYIGVVLLALLSSVAMSGIPGGGYIAEYIICLLFFPDKMELAYPIAVSIGNLVDPPATMINATGDYAVSFMIERFVDGRDWLKKRLYRTEEAA
ncbi:MAG TPA: dicarboxylate/amino acid:cation symporter [Clostridia bacterium]|nr:dicarboxylate/amino acid:cation symporter [Clostridia bacterium]